MATLTDNFAPETGTAQTNGAPAACVSATGSHSIRLLQSGESYRCSGEETLLQGMAKLGRKGIPAGCLNGGCGVCRVLIRSGNVRKTGVMSRAHISEQDEAQGLVLACRVAPGSDVELDVIGCIRKSLLRAVP
jgi:ferredoxin